MLPDYQPSTACNRLLPRDDLGSVTTVITLFGVSTTATLLTFTNSIPASAVSMTPFIGSVTTGLAGYSVVPQVTLVHRAQDLPATGGDGGGGKPPNAAGQGRGRAANAGARWAFLASICAIAMSSVAVLAL